MTIGPFDKFEILRDPFVRSLSKTWKGFIMCQLYSRGAMQHKDYWHGKKKQTQSEFQFGLFKAKFKFWLNLLMFSLN